jgi:hypothetical protein
VVDLVQVMDTVNRTRFAANAATLAEWETVSNIIGPAHPAADKPAPATPPTGGEVRPAA